MHAQQTSSQAIRDSRGITNAATSFQATNGQAQPSARVVFHSQSQRSDPCSTSSNLLENLPVEIVGKILSYLVQPRSRLPGLTEQESSCESSSSMQRTVKNRENLSTPPDTDRFAANLFDWTTLRHPFNALAGTSRRCQNLVENYCFHLVKTCNKFNLPFDHAEKYGPNSVYPSLDSIVYRRLWLQTAPRDCIFCGATLSNYPHRGFRLLLCCEDCFYAQTLDLHEVQHQYHMHPMVLRANKVRATSERYEWILRIDVEALALKLYGTRAFHDTQSQGLNMPCVICGVAKERSPETSVSRSKRPRSFPSNPAMPPEEMELSYF